jgi:NADPH-dependent 2,4-dienoyl-CoA reductase/sulfur reductase-like enzyme/rhodanese-related sulfurtransferase
MNGTRIVIVGGVAGGASAATRARRINESARIVVFEKGEHVSFANCGLPYHIGGQIAERGKLLLATPESFRSAFNIDVRTRHEVLAIDRAGKRVQVLNHRTGERFHEPYDKLILAPGAAPITPPWKGVDRPNVFTLRDVADMDLIKSFVETRGPRRAIVVGAGFIGLEMVEALVERGLHVSVVELQPQVLPPMDPEMAREIVDVLRGKGVELHLGASVENLVDDGQRVTGVRLAAGAELPADLVLISIGVRPMVKLAVDAGLAVGSGGGIAVDAQLRTTDADIFAVGDAAEVVHTVTGESTRMALAGPANRNGRLAGEMAATGVSKTATPVAGTAIVGLFGQSAAMTGLSAKAARQRGIPHAVSYAIRGHHAGYYPGAQQMILKLVFDPHTGRVLGAQAVGGEGVDKRIDAAAATIHFRGTIDDLAGLDLAYAPQFGSAKDPLHIAAFGAQNQRDGLCKSVAPGEPIPDGQLIDVRDESELAGGSLPGAVNIPLPQLRERMGEIAKDRPVVIFCQVGQRGYNASRILMQSGYRDVYNLAGGYRLHRAAWTKKCGTSGRS